MSHPPARAKSQGRRRRRRVPPHVAPSALSSARARSAAALAAMSAAASGGAARDPPAPDADAETLSSLFGAALRLHAAIEQNEDGLETNSKEFQERVQKAILMLEDSTRLVSALDIFSRNETVSEVATAHVRYFLLPALLGDLHGRLLCSPRLDAVRVCEAYHRDFLQRCADYEIADVAPPPPIGDDDDDDAPPPAIRDLAAMNRERDAKLRRYREQKALDARVRELRPAVLDGAAADDDTVREFYLALVRRAVIASADEIKALAQELPLLRHMSRRLQGGDGGDGGLSNGHAAPPAAERSRPLKPIVITRDQAQKRVFGAGYSSLPVLSVDEFYDQRVREGWWQPPGSQAASGSLLGRTTAEFRGEADAEEREKDEKEDRDDPESIAKARHMDAYKDEHRRGEGNRHNMG